MQKAFYLFHFIHEHLSRAGSREISQQDLLNALSSYNSSGVETSYHYGPYPVEHLCRPDPDYLAQAAAYALALYAQEVSINRRDLLEELNGIAHKLRWQDSPKRKKIRGFETVQEEHNKNLGAPAKLPTRSSAQSAGYDFYAPCAVVIFPGETTTIFTDVKAYMQPGEVLQLYPRSSLGKKGLQLLNTVGIVDADYYSNPDNDGNIGLMIRNVGKEELVIKAGDRIAQGIFMPYLLADGDDTQAERQGGFGSTGQ